MCSGIRNPSSGGGEGGCFSRMNSAFLTLHYKAGSTEIRDRRASHRMGLAYRPDLDGELPARRKAEAFTGIRPVISGL
jgi:hypothetical protein